MGAGVIQLKSKKMVKRERARSIIQQHDKEFKKFLLGAHKGFEKGAREHGEGANEEMDLLTEIQEELRDVACYAFFQFKRLEGTKKRMEESRECKGVLE